MEIFNTTNKDAIFYKDEREASQDAPEATETPSATEQAERAIKRANEVMAQGKNQEEAKEPNAYEQYVALKLSNPTEAGAFWRAHKDAIYACINN